MCRTLNIAQKPRSTNVKSYFSTVNYENRLKPFSVPKQHPVMAKSPLVNRLRNGGDFDNAGGASPIVGIHCGT